MIQIALPLVYRVCHRHVVAVGIDDLIQTPLEDFARIRRIGLARGGRLAEQIARALFIRRFPVGFPISGSQFFNAAKTAFNFRPILPATNRHQIRADAGEAERVVIAAVIDPEPCLALNRPDFQLPARSQPPVAVAAPILEAQRRLDAVPAWRHLNGDAGGHRAREEIGLHGAADACQRIIRVGRLRRRVADER